MSQIVPTWNNKGVLCLAEHALDRDDRIETSSTVELQQRDQSFLLLTENIETCLIFHILYTSGSFISVCHFFTIWKAKVIHATLTETFKFYVYNPTECVCVRVCVFTTFFERKEIETVQNKKFALLENN